VMGDREVIWMRGPQTCEFVSGIESQVNLP
jgi:hypothetical protein